ncbi:flagellar basal body L-ring protein FlgH [Sinimarinibacterium thermocellulolyticum]|uniref:flagellar basal body L-ring protein FlgH n=1 Tax=Sinimarinibacterium thermocellulolyticum TaxID=3170016 RepID=UPI003DA14CD7
MRTAIGIAALAVSACATSPGPDPYRLPPEAVATPAPVSNGSIYASAQSIALFEDRKARQVGDVLTVLLVERTDAKKSAATNTKKDASFAMPGPTLFGRPVTAGGTEVLDFDIRGERGFTGAGGSTQSNALTGSVSVLIAQVLPNGNFVVRGEKQIAINRGSETVSIEGIVREADIAADNTVRSDRVANARIHYGGRGELADANAQGWLSRFFNSPWFPF